ncbi:MAG: DNA internalization-related competence protein ComEC/Rec2 [Desulfatibacillaceae bacterium]|nr:DNA internalization-related competence protein ComEC/Rec2 [Desulfatibacillaceae bacterium]
MGRKSAESNRPLARPLIVWFACLAAGIWAGWHFPALAPWALAMAIVSGAVCIFLVSKNRGSLVFPLLLFIGLGHISILPWSAPNLGPEHISNHLPHEMPVTISGIVDERPRQLDDRTRFVVTVESLLADGKTTNVKGRIQATVRPGVGGLLQGDKVLFEARLNPASNFKNPGAFDYEGFLQRQDIWATASVRGGPKGLVRMEQARLGVLEKFRRQVKKIISQAAKGDALALLEVLVLGQRDAPSKDLQEKFSKSGTAHVLAISGLHVGMVAGIIFLLIRKLLLFFRPIAESGMAWRIAAVIALIPAFFYAALAGMPPSTQRAIFMVAAFFLAAFAWRPYNSLNTLGAAALALVIIRPPILFDLSFQLSFCAVAAIIAGTGRIGNLGTSHERGVKPPFYKRLGKRALLFFLVSVFAILGTAPFVLRAFYGLSTYGPVSNLVMIPLLGFLVLPIGLLAALFAPVIPSVSTHLMGLAGFGAGLMVKTASFFSELPFSWVMPLYPSVFESICYFALLVCLVNLGRAKMARIALAVILGAIAVNAGYWIYERHFNPSLRVTLLDVGKGNAAFVCFPGGKTMLVDGGGFVGAGMSFDTGEKIVAPFLWGRKVHKVDIVALSHPHQDHIGGLPFIVRNFRPGEVWMTGQEASLAAWGALIDACQEKGVPVKTIEQLEGGFLFGGAKVEVLHPQADDAQGWRPDKDMNNNSLVLKISLGNTSFQLPGDIQKRAEDRMLARLPQEKLASTVLVVPHHGSSTSSPRQFIDAVKPQVAIISAGSRNFYGLPHPVVVERYRQSGALVLETGIRGAVQMKTRGDWLTVEAPYRQRLSHPRGLAATLLEAPAFKAVAVEAGR